MITNQLPEFPFKTVLEQIHEIEIHYQLYKYDVDGWSAWTIIRESVANAMAKLPWNTPSRDPDIGRLQKYVIALRDAPNILWPPKTRYVLKTHTSALREKHEGLFKDIFIDDLLLELDSKQYYKIEDLNSKTYMPRRSKALIKSNSTSLFFRLAAVLFSHSGRPKFIRKVSEELSFCLTNLPNLQVFTPLHIAGRLLNFYWSKRLYGKFLDRSQPEVIIMCTHGQYPLVAAARERGIEVIELQHGSPNRYKIPYAWSSKATAFKFKIPVPDRIFLYGEFFRLALAETGFWQEELHPVGSILMDKYRLLRKNYKSNKRDANYTLVLTTQGIEVSKLITFFKEFLRICEGRFKMQLIFKLHPHFETNKNAYLPAFSANENVHILLGNEPPSTFDLLIRADFHLTIYSTTHYDAIGLGVPTIILPFTNYEMMLPLHRAGHAFLVENPQELFDIIWNNRSAEIPERTKGYYYKPDALNNMKSALGIGFDNK
jgi:hypothetical protein